MFYLWLSEVLLFSLKAIAGIFLNIYICGENTVRVPIHDILIPDVIEVPHIIRELIIRSLKNIF